MPIPHIEIQAADGSLQAPSDVMRDMVESGVYDKVLAGSEKPKKKGGKKKAEEEYDGKGVFKFEYASSGRSKCKCTYTV